MTYTPKDYTHAYLKDNQGTPHYWRVTIDSSGMLVQEDIGTTAPVEL